jgi:hypothetical protein
MAIARKPHRSPAPAAGTETEIEALINRGGSPSGTAAEEEKPAAVPIMLRVPKAMLDQIEAALKVRPVKLPRHTWILEAIHEKLTRENR